MDFIKDIQENDRKTFFKDFENSKKYSECSEEEVPNKSSNSRPLIADFTEYSPLHNGHFHCMKTAKEKIPDGLFVAVVPGLFERSGRGLPYILHRKTRAEIAIAVGADIVVEGPPMGIMGSGQYSLCLTKMFQALNTDFIPRGYRPFDGYEKILERISLGHGVAPKPYKIVDMDTKEVIYNGKLEEDNYVIVSFSKSLKKIGFDFKDKFIFVPRIEGVSGTLIRKACSENNLESVKSMLPSETLRILEREINEDRAPLHDLRVEDYIIDSANNLSFEDLLKLNFFNEKLAKELVEKREEKPFESIAEIENSIFYGFSSHFKNRVLSILETKINADMISEYINNYPSTVRVLNYKNEAVLEEFKDKVFENGNKFVKNIVTD
ncbi:MAG: nucleotidyltransferase family protein [Methanobrevibacter sp.]|uniref:nucleotidyltransferase family protein n=1 Tax=Methanobrevibacter sp. TaxID=66852 RepID=UPI0025E7E0A1|nr:nucleotidyltransferase family protein [Methanobrevibacter sp.]MBQ6139396.1 nucleotidyltransferase family protein [Methanobrevibacter sp.]